MKEIIEKLANFENLSSVEMTDVIERIVTGRVTEAQIASLLLALKMKGETPEERTALAQVMFGHVNATTCQDKGCSCRNVEAK